MISILVLVGLAVVWAIVVFPDVVRWISNNRRGDTIRTFNSQLSSLGRSNAVRDDNVIDLRDRMISPLVPGNSMRVPESEVVPIGARKSVNASPDGLKPAQQRSAQSPDRSSAQSAPRPVSPAVRKRRQDVLVALGAACLLTLLATIAFGPAFLYLHLLADVFLVGYLVALQRTVSSGSAARRPGGHNTVSPVGGLAPTGTVGMRSHVVEPRRIAN